MKPLKIGPLTVDNPILPSPLAGFTDSSFRVMLARYGAKLVFTEMLSAGGIIKDPRGSKIYLKRREEEGCVGYQLVGSNPKWMAEAAQTCVEEGAVLIDINAGCTDKNIRKTGSGSELLRTPELIAQNIKAIRKAVDVPVTVKVRIPAKNDPLDHVGLAKLVEEAGASMITVHGRTPAVRFAGVVDLNAIRQVKETVDIPVVGNGDVRDARDAKRMFEVTGCDGIMVGRAILGNPWLPGAIWSELSEKKKAVLPSNKMVLDTLFQQAQMKLEDKGERRAFLEMRYHFSKYLKGRKVSKELWNRAVRVGSYNDVLEMIDLLDTKWR